MRESRNNAERALIACSLWLHLGFVAAAVMAAGLLLLFDGQVTWLSALALAGAGGVLAGVSWRRGLAALGHTGQRRRSSQTRRASRPRAALPGKPDAAR